MYICIRWECDANGYHQVMCLYISFFQGKLTRFPCLEIQISTHKDCFKVLWKSLEIMDCCQDISVMFFCPVEYASAVKKQCSKPSVTTSNTTSSEVRLFLFLLLVLIALYNLCIVLLVHALIDYIFIQNSVSKN